MEGGYVNFERIVPILKMYGIDEMKDKFLLIGLVQNRKTAEAFFSDFRKYDTADDWTYGLADDDLWAVSEEAVSFSRSMTEHLAKYGFTLYDTSAERERVLGQVMADIRANLA